MKLKSLVFVLGLVLVSTCTYAQKGKNIGKAIETAISRKAVGTAAKAPKVPRVSATNAIATAPNVATPAKPKAARAKFNIRNYPIHESREEFLARWNAMTFEEQLADWNVFERRYRAFDEEGYNPNMAEEDEEWKSLEIAWNMHAKALNRKQVEITTAMSVAKEVKSPEQFDVAMTDFLLQISTHDYSVFSNADWTDGDMIAGWGVSDGLEIFTFNRTEVLKRAGKEGPEHAISTQEQEKYAQFIRKILNPARMNEQRRALENYYLQERRSPLKSVFAAARRLYNFQRLEKKTPCFVNRQTGDLGLVFELPGPVTIDDGINPPQVLNPETQVIFFAADPVTKEFANVYVEERAKFEDPFAYNLVTPHPKKLAAEQPMPANAAQPLDPKLYAKVKAKVAQYRKKYYDKK